MVQLHSYYITNAKSELRFSSSNMNVDELETEIQKVITAMINNNDLNNIFCLFISPTIPPHFDKMRFSFNKFSDCIGINSNEISSSTTI
uniref:Uncharacterized protein n=1 Tax=Rhizophagus irregularis (strain DAOM 181602 / DAOM 197198 / MUCL 43194) TaxID=747089 RepID=U9TVM3_RHIID